MPTHRDTLTSPFAHGPYTTPDPVPEAEQPVKNSLPVLTAVKAALLLMFILCGTTSSVWPAYVFAGVLMALATVKITLWFVRETGKF